MTLASVLVIAVATGCGGSGDGTNGAETVERKSGPTIAVLHPVGEMQAAGTARYLKKPNGLPMIKLDIRGLEPATGDRQYAVWQKHSRYDMIILATWVVGKNGRLVQSWTPSAASLQYLERGIRTKLLITKVGLNDRLYEPSPSDNSYRHHFIGTPVLEGDFTGALVGSEEES